MRYDGTVRNSQGEVSLLSGKWHVRSPIVLYRLCNSSTARMGTMGGGSRTRTLITSSCRGSS